MVAFTKQAIINSKTYWQYADVLAVILDENKCYTHEEIATLLDVFFNGKKQVETKKKVKKSGVND